MGMLLMLASPKLVRTIISLSFEGYNLTEVFFHTEATTADSVKLSDLNGNLRIIYAVTVFVRFYSLYLLVLVDGNPVDTDELNTKGNRTGALLSSDPLTSSGRDLSAGSEQQSEVSNDD